MRGIHRSPVNSPRKGQWCGALMFHLICTWTNGWASHRYASDLRRNCSHYDVTVMCPYSNEYNINCSLQKITYIRYTLLSYMTNTDYSSTLQAPVCPWKPFNFLAGCSFQSFRHRLLCLNNLNHWGTWRLFATFMRGLGPLMRLTRTHLLLSSRSIWAPTLYSLIHKYDRLYSSPCYQWPCIIRHSAEWKARIFSYKCHPPSVTLSNVL